MDNDEKNEVKTLCSDMFQWCVLTDSYIDKKNSKIPSDKPISTENM